MKIFFRTRWFAVSAAMAVAATLLLPALSQAATITGLTLSDGTTDLTVVEAVPEPSTFALAALGLFGLGLFVRRRGR